MNIPLGPGIGQCCGGYVQVKLSLHNNSKDALKNEYIVNNIKPTYISLDQDILVKH